VIISGDGMTKELFYVAASRGRQSVTVITNDKERLRETVARVDDANVGVRAYARYGGTLASRRSSRLDSGARHGS